ncbi:hypothetical protein HETIRDRAFT_167766 [Heterobasidion irregulare TC 32-1]|uniref:Uncharacterized protein n=1 Tax=Heterobasidion irregulare (strain TC 32-1) TaxID=747525 RepID=W4KLT0_HETIT|nr:uncharacterized protein HETIRDRAFT_167766 [Heterobasidion irregulare TC 32-1]ETW86021.1 hypothetical protein HETIRDRAFT_167766 [Heterobasidion irregulare TC 32-1]
MQLSFTRIVHNLDIAGSGWCDVEHMSSVDDGKVSADAFACLPLSAIIKIDSLD